jgi:hypothetical protein
MRKTEGDVMTRVDVNHASEPDGQIVYPEKEVIYVDRTGESTTAAGINLIMVLIVLVVLVGLLALIFYGLPSWFGTSTVNVNIRTQ